MNIVLILGTVLASTERTFTFRIADETGTEVLCVGQRQEPNTLLSLRGRLRQATIDGTSMTVVEVLNWLPWESQHTEIPL